MTYDEIALISASCGIWLASATGRDTNGVTRAVCFALAVLVLLSAIKRMVQR